LTRYVVDATVIAKWYVEEIRSDRARLLLAGGHELVAPDYVLVECANTFVKKLRSGEMMSAIAKQAIRDVAVVVETAPASALLDSALELAEQYQRNVYDALYVVLARAERRQLVTDDGRLVNAFRRDLPETVLWLGDLAESV
jgi:predicted nucleic acid-binding protein